MMDVILFNSLALFRARDNLRTTISEPFGILFCILSASGSMRESIGSAKSRRRTIEFPLPRILRRLFANFVHLLSRARVGLFLISFIPCQDAGILVECSALNPSSARAHGRVRFRRMAHVPPHGNYEIRDTGHVLSRLSRVPLRHAGSTSSWPRQCPGVLERRRLAKVRMMYRAAMIMVSLAPPSFSFSLVVETSSRSSSIIFNADKYARFAQNYPRITSRSSCVK